MKQTTIIKQTWVLALFILLSRLTVQAQDGMIAPDSIYTPNVSSTVHGIAVLTTNGDTLIGGDFTQVNGNTNYAGIAWLTTNAPATVNPSFPARVRGVGSVNYIAVQADGKILIAGNFTNVSGVTNNDIVRLNGNGTVDSSFNPNGNGSISCTAMQADGKFLIGGSFTSMGGASRTNFARLNTNGTADSGFTNLNLSGSVQSIAVLADGKILVAGGFNMTINGTNYNRIARLNTNGTVDPSFIPNVTGSISCIAVQADGKIVVGGSGVIASVGATNYSNLARLNPNGTLDSSFNPKPNNFVSSIAVQTDGQMLIGGLFTTLGGVTSRGLARLNPDGTVEDGSTFVGTNVAGQVRGIALQADGTILIGGSFSSVNGTACNNMTRLWNGVFTPSSQTLLAPDTTRVQWLRSGPAPEVSWVTFELSTDNGNTWTNLGTGTRINGGWQLAGLNLPASGYLRARGRAPGGESNGSSSLIDQITSYSAGVPAVVINAVATGGKLILTWPSGTLQSATAVGGPYTNVPSAASPFTNNNPTLPQSFYRVKVQ